MGCLPGWDGVMGKVKDFSGLPPSLDPSDPRFPSQSLRYVDKPHQILAETKLPSSTCKIFVLLYVHTCVCVLIFLPCVCTRICDAWRMK